MQTIGNAVVGALESVKDTIEKRDEAVLQRQHVFASPEKNDLPAVAAENAEEQLNLDKFKKVTYELLDIGVFYGQQGVGKVKSLPLYQKVDSVVNFDDKFAVVKKHGE